MMFASFIGTHGSMGFRSGRAYSIKTVVSNCCIYVLEASGLWCPYESLDALLKNWEILDSRWSI